MAVAGLLLLLASTLRWGWDAHRAPLAVPGDTATSGELLEASRAEMEEDELRHRPLEASETLDPNRAPAAQLDRLPGVGPSTARAIVKARETGGFFLSPDDLLRVRGIGPATLDRMRPHLDFHHPPPGPGVAVRPGRGPATPGSVVGEAAPNRIDVNRADEGRLQELSGIGPALARRIVEFRAARGPFLRLEDLLEVPGIGPATLERIRDRVTAGG